MAAVDVLACTAFLKERRAKIHGTNPPDRLKGEIKRRTDVPGAFPTKPPSFACSAPSCSSRTTKHRAALLHEPGNARLSQRYCTP
jgi:transposase-like protein